MSRWGWDKYYNYIKELELQPETHSLLKWLKSYYKAQPSVQQVSTEDLLTYMQFKQVPAEALAIAEAQLRTIRPLTPEATAVYSKSLQQNLVASQMKRDLLKFEQGDCDLEQAYPALFEDFVNPDSAVEWETDVVGAVQRELEDYGWNLNFLPFGEALRGVRRGHNILIAAPTDMGKTWFLCRMAVHLLEQILKEWREELKENSEAKLRPILFATNEQAADIILTRVVQTVLHKSLHELADLPNLKELYEEHVPAGAIRIQNVHGQSAQQVAALAAKYNAQVLITDMTQRCGWTGGYASEHQDLEAVWNYFREQAILKDFLHIGTSQISIEGHDQLFPPLTALKQSKTGIQNTVDLAIYIGARTGTDTVYEKLRGVSTPKNKLQRAGFRRYNTAQVQVQFETNTWNQS